MQNVTLIAKN